MDETAAKAAKLVDIMLDLNPGHVIRRGVSLLQHPLHSLPPLDPSIQSRLLRLREHHETVAEHTGAVQFLADILEPHFPHINMDHVKTLLSTHDLAEIYTGDLIPRDGVPKDEKERRERIAIQELAERTGNAKIIPRWEEYNAGQTPEAAFAKQIDKLQFLVKAWNIERDILITMGKEAPERCAGERTRHQTRRELIGEFLENVREGNTIRDPLLRECVEEMQHRFAELDEAYRDLPKTSAQWRERTYASLQARAPTTSGVIKS